MKHVELNIACWTGNSWEEGDRVAVNPNHVTMVHDLGGTRQISLTCGDGFQATQGYGDILFRLGWVDQDPEYPCTTRNPEKVEL